MSLTTRASPGDRPLVIFDLDETVVRTTEESLLRQPGTLRLASHTILVRPGLDRLLSELALGWKLAIWTEGTADYAEFIAERASRPHCDLEFVWSRERCTPAYDPELAESYRVKNLKKIFRRGYDKRRVLMLDNTPRKLERQYGNLVQVEDWMGEIEDNELELLRRYLAALINEPDFRSIEKRGWRSSVSSV